MMALRAENRALALTTAPRSIVVYTPPAVVVPPSRQRIDVYKLTANRDGVWSWIAAPEDLPRTLAEIVTGYGVPHVVTITRNQTWRHEYDAVMQERGVIKWNGF